MTAPNPAPTTMNESQLVRVIKAHIEKGDKAKDKAEQHYIAAGQHLKTLKAEHRGSWSEWEGLLKIKIGIGKSRASELMQIADGRKTVEEVRTGGADRKREHDERKKISPLRNGENAATLEVSAEEETAVCQKISMTPLQGTTSWRVQVTDESGKVWSNGVRLAGRDEAMCYMGYALHDFSDNELAIVEIRAIECRDAPNVGVARCQRGPRKGRARIGNEILFDHGACHLFGWQDIAQQPTLAVCASNDDGLDIPGFLQRAPKAAAS